MQLIVTRPAPDGADLSAKLAALGHQPLVAPVMTILTKADIKIPPKDYAYVAITSANGARALAAHAACNSVLQATAVTVGPASTAAARQAGFSKIMQADGDLNALIKLMRQQTDQPKGPVLYVAGVKTSGDLPRELAKSGYPVTKAVLYEARPVDVMEGDVQKALATNNVDGVTLFSPRTARLWAELCRISGLAKQAQQLHYYCLSQAVAAAVSEEISTTLAISIAQRPDEAAFLAMF